MATAARFSACATAGLRYLKPWEVEVVTVIDVLKIDTQARVADLSIRQGCPACDGALVVRATPHGSWSHCRNCHWLSRSKLSWTPSGIQLMHPTAVA